MTHCTHCGSEIHDAPIVRERLRNGETVQFDTFECYTRWRETRSTTNNERTAA